MASTRCRTIDPRTVTSTGSRNTDGRPAPIPSFWGAVWVELCDWLNRAGSWSSMHCQYCSVHIFFVIFFLCVLSSVPVLHEPIGRHAKRCYRLALKKIEWRCRLALRTVSLLARPISEQPVVTVERPTPAHTPTFSIGASLQSAFRCLVGARGRCYRLGRRGALSLLC